MSSGFNFDMNRLRPWRRWAIIWSVVIVVGLIGFALTWNIFFEYVPPGKHLIIIAKEGDELPANQVLAKEGQKGILEDVKGEGWHFVMPVIYTTKLGDNTTIPTGKIGIVTSRVGAPLTEGRVLAEDTEQGLRRNVLAPGTYRLNAEGFVVETVPATIIEAGFVGVQRRLLGKDGTGRFATNDQEKGIIRSVLQPGLYYLNTREFQVVPYKVGIFQSSFRFDQNPRLSTAIEFTSKGGFPVSMDCTIEWEILPENVPDLVAEYGERQAIEQTVIDLQAHAISRDKGIDYGVQDFLEGTKREKFQEDCTKELIRVCKDKKVTIHSAFIRNIVIPEAYLKPIREKQIATETEITNQAKEVTAQVEAEMEREKRLVQQRVAEVEAETNRIVGSLEREVENVGIRTTAEIEKMRAEYDAKIAKIDAERTTVTGKAVSDAKTLVETARGQLFELKMQVFQSDANAFLQYSFAEQLNPKMVLRLFHAGPGTFWTNMDGKSFNLMLPAGGASQPNANRKDAKTPKPE